MELRLLEYKLDNLNTRIARDMEKLSQYFDFSKFEKYHDGYYAGMAKSKEGA